MRFEVVTLFPESFPGVLQMGLTGKALRDGRFTIHPIDPRAFATDKHRTVDDTPYGGGPGMVMKVEPVVLALAEARRRGPGPVVLLSPQGRPLAQQDLQRWSGLAHLILVAGRYEGFDERIRSFVDDEVSIGDFVLTGGEYVAQAVIDGIVRLLPGTLGNVGSASADSFQDGLLEHPHYTRPAEFKGRVVPAVLTQGDHGKIADWRRAQSLLRTRARRPELLEAADLTDQDRDLLLAEDACAERGLGLALELRPEPTLLQMAERLLRAYELRRLGLVAATPQAGVALQAWVDATRTREASQPGIRVYRTWAELCSEAPVVGLMRDRQDPVAVIAPRVLRGPRPWWLGIGAGLPGGAIHAQLPPLRRATRENRLSTLTAAAVALDRIWSER